MTIFEVARYVPLGSTVTLFEWNRLRTEADRGKQHRGIIMELRYGAAGSAHRIVLHRDGSELVIPVEDIANIEIEKQPADYDVSATGVAIDQAAWSMHGTVREFMKYMNSFKRQELDLSFQTELPDETEQLCTVLSRVGLDKAVDLIRNWKKLSFEKWQMLFEQMYVARTDAEATADPDTRWLRRAEAYICCRARKDNGFIYDRENKDPIAYAIGLLVRNLAENKAKIRDESSFGDGTYDRELAMDWMLLGLCYHRSGMHSSCAYAALIQSVIQMGRFYENSKNRQTFIHLCANAHDFMFLRYLLEWYRADGRRQTRAALKEIGCCVCWMMYQMGGSGILDAADLLASVDGSTESSLPQFRERMLAYVYKYAPRNRNDRYMAITYAMGRLLERLSKQMDEDAEEPELDYNRFGYLYEFHGGKDLPVGYYDGFILGQDFLSYRISYPADSYHRLPLMIQAMSERARETGERAVFEVRFDPQPAGLLYRYQADSDFRFENGGMFDL